MGTVRLFEIRLDIWERCEWPGIWVAIASPNGIAWERGVRRWVKMSVHSRSKPPLWRLTCERVGFELGRIVSLESVCSLICGRLIVAGTSRG
jgi:hypothetical protein